MWYDYLAFFLFSLSLPSIRIWIIGMLRGARYAANNKEANPFMKWVSDNLHRVSEYQYRILYLSGCFGCFGFFRLFGFDAWISMLFASIYSFISLTQSSVGYQGYINWGSGKPFIDTEEYDKSEVSVFNWGFWRKRFVKGYGRLLATSLGFLIIVFICLYLYYYGNNS